MGVVGLSIVRVGVETASRGKVRGLEQKMEIDTGV